MSDNFIPTAVEQLRFAPEIILTIAGAVVMLLEGILFKQSKDEHADRGSLGYVAIIGLLAAMVATVIANGEPGLAFQGMIITDGFATFFRLLVMAVGILTILTSTNYLSEARANNCAAETRASRSLGYGAANAGQIFWRRYVGKINRCRQRRQSFALRDAGHCQGKWLEPQRGSRICPGRQQIWL